MALGAFVGAGSRGVVGVRRTAAVARRNSAAGTAVASRARRCAVVRMSGDGEGATAVAEEVGTGEEKYEFQAEVSRVMNIIINSLYSNTEIFLRELVSNASDACDKRRFLALSQGSSLDGELAVRVRADKSAGTVTIEDNGVGMTKAELMKNLGSIATSGTAKFVDALGKNNGDVSQIGQFGVGFYSAFLVADKVTVYTRSMTALNDENAENGFWQWESTSASGYSVKAIGAAEAALPGGCGSRVVLHIKSGHLEFLENTRLKALMKRYSEFVDFPIFAWEETTETEEVEDEAATREAREAAAEGEEVAPVMKKVPRTVARWTRVNDQKPIWMRRPKEVKDEEYKEFYKSVSKEFDEPTAWTHFAAEGDVEFRSVLFTPATLPFELRQDMFNNAGRNLKLYVKRVFISEKFEEFLPRWLCFLRGVIDSEDLPLNVSREILQQSRVLRVITKRVVRKAIDMFVEIAERENPADYVTFWKNFGRYIKAGIIDDAQYAGDLSKLLRFYSSTSGDSLVSLQQYVSRMKPGQKDIFYIVADSRPAADSAPVLEKLKAQGYEVLYLLEPVDEIAVENLAKYKTKRNEEDAEPSDFKLVNVSREGFSVGNEDEQSSEDAKLAKEKLEENKKRLKPVSDFLKETLGNKVSKVEVTDSLTESPVAIVQSAYGVSPSMERFMRANQQSSGVDDSMFGDMFGGNKVLQINPAHPVIEDLALRVSAPGAVDDGAKDVATLLYELALLSGGYTVDDTGGFAKRVARIMAGNISAQTSGTSSSRSSGDGAKDDEDEDDAPAVKTEIVT
mmetsp:Transcript_6402/g.17141  ORF Transcript_6402/g.17141 Transcript_6402/m.17141 type:complete len:794 (+) Transcript_6402:20-2401(+)